MINMINRDDIQHIGAASDYANMRFWSPEFIIGEFDKLVDMGVRTLRISDEMFLLNRKFYAPLCELLINRGYGNILNLWSYSRVDTVRRVGDIQLLKSAGFKWLCLGIESGDKAVRLEVSKGKFEDVNIKEVIRTIQDNEIKIIANYMFGLPEDNHRTMQKTLGLSLELCTLAWNAYPTLPLPGSEIYRKSLEAGYIMPENYEDYSFHSYTTKPLPTKYLTPEEVLRFRDYAFMKYHRHEPFLSKVESELGLVARKNIEELTKVTLKRQILGD